MRSEFHCPFITWKYSRNWFRFFEDSREGEKTVGFGSGGIGRVEREERGTSAAVIVTTGRSAVVAGLPDIFFPQRTDVPKAKAAVITKVRKACREPFDGEELLTDIRRFRQ